MPNSTLDMLLCLIDEGMEHGQIGIVTLYISLISRLNSNSLWRNKVIDFVDKIFSFLLESFDDHTITPKYSQSKLLNFFYALNCAPLSSGIGHWIELKNDNRVDSNGNNLQKSHIGFKCILLKNLYYEVSTNSFSMLTYEPDSRRLISFKDLKYNSDFKKLDANNSVFNESHLELNSSMIIKLIELVKKLLFKYKTSDIQKPDRQIENDSNLSPFKQKIYRYEIMHLIKKKEVHYIFQQLHLKNNLLLCSVLTLIKDFFLKQNNEQDHFETFNKKLDDELFVDLEFISWISKLAFSNTNMNAFWKLSHLRCYLVSLLLREGFENLKESNLDDKNNNLTKKYCK
jgi:hypothetical protein